MTEPPRPDPDVGLCSDCRHARRIVSSRDTVFWQCRLAAADPSFPKYPRLPVHECRGHSPRAEAQRRDEAGD
jgi:hypothetical protein